MDIQQEVELIKKELVELIVAHLKENKIDVPTSQKLAQDFLAVLPVSDQQDLLAKLKELGHNYKEAQQLYVEELGKASVTKRDEALTVMRDCIAKGNIEKAIDVAKTMTGEK